jgi:hypothetical protein
MPTSKLTCKIRERFTCTSGQQRLHEVSLTIFSTYVVVQHEKGGKLIAFVRIARPDGRKSEK